MTSHKDHFIRSCTDWLFRPKSVGRYAMRIGLGLIGLAFALGWALKVSMPSISLSVSSGEGTPAILTYSIAGLGAFLILAGLVFDICCSLGDRRRLARKRVVVIEGRGLRDGPGSPLADALPASVQGTRELLLLDLRQRVEDGVIVRPETILPRIEGLAAQVEQRLGASDRSDVTVAYGGMTAVPFTFLTGIMLDDEARIVVLDWSRKVENWLPLDQADDGKAFTVQGIDDAVGVEIVLAVSFSYPILDANLTDTFPAMPVVRLTLDEGSPEAHWSETKQARLAEQFLNTVIQLGGRGVRRIHLVLAAPNSVVFRLGRAYDKRNLPSLTVYQFENGSTPPYPWGVEMPVAGLGRAAITRLNSEPLPA